MESKTLKTNQGFGKYFAATRDLFDPYFGAQTEENTHPPVRGQRPQGLAVESLEKRVLL